MKTTEKIERGGTNEITPMIKGRLSAYALAILAITGPIGVSVLAELGIEKTASERAENPENVRSEKLRSRIEEIARYPK